MSTGNSPNVELVMLPTWDAMRRPYPVALPWFETENYDALRSSLADGDDLPLSYETWLVATEQIERQVRDCGVKVVRVPIRPDEFAAWCVKNDAVSDGEARSRYATDILDAGTGG